MPDPDAYPATLRNVLHVAYLMFNEATSAATAPILGRPDLADEAIRVARLVHGQLPDDAEAAGLLRLMLLVDARRPPGRRPTARPSRSPTRTGARWDRAMIAEGTGLLDAAIGGGRVGEYQLQAAIAALHDRRRRPPTRTGRRSTPSTNCSSG
jgi:predicted RNA polymerase sigma factor